MEFDIIGDFPDFLDYDNLVSLLKVFIQISCDFTITNDFFRLLRDFKYNITL